MIIKKIEIVKALDCDHIKLEFPLQQQNNSVLIIQSFKECDVISTAIQLICSMRFAGPDSLNTYKDKLYRGKISLSFLLPASKGNLNDQEKDCNDTPCTSQQSRSQKEINVEDKNMLYHSISATRDFLKDPFLIEYTFNCGVTVTATIEKFHSTFFNAIDLLLPNLLQLAYGQNCNGKWINMIPFDKEEDNLLKQFCIVHDCKLIDLNNLLAKLVTITLTTRCCMQLGRISYTLQVFLDIRHIFEFITCSEYTVWFLLPTECEQKSALINTMQEIDFEKMQTMVQLKTECNNNNTQIQWFKAERHIQELLLISIQLAFAYHCQQKIVYLRSLKHLSRHQNFELFNAILTCPQKMHTSQNWFTKHYLQRIVDVCLKLGITSIIELPDGLSLPIIKTFNINCEFLNNSWHMSVTTQRQFQSQAIEKFLHVIQGLY